MFTAVLVACLVSAPTECKTHEMMIQGNGLPVSAFIEAQTQAAEWLSKHPDLRQERLIIRPGIGV